jgi:phosphatidylserine synthase
MGQVLDSISDSISFAFAPAFLLYGELHDMASSSPTYSVWNMVVLAGAVCFLSCGLFRLARFSVGGYQLKYFMGMPAPGAAMVLLLLCLLFGAESGAEPADMYFVVWHLPGPVLVLGFVLSFLMASEIPYPKVKGWMARYGVAAMAAAAPAVVAGLVIVADQPLYTASSRTAATIALALMLVYSLGGPIHERLKRG